MTGSHTGTSTSEGTLHDLVSQHAATLAAAGVPSPAHDATVLARHVLGLTVAGVRTAPLPATDDRVRLAELVERRARREPLQLITGATWFRYLRLRCEPGVFIPRPETEVVAGVAIDAARLAGPRPVVVEPCTGTGAIALSVAVEVPGARVVATDVSEAAVALARANLEHAERGGADVAGLAVDASCEILHGDLLAPLDPALRGAVDVLVSNPPYLPSDDLGGLAPEVAEHDPHGALFGGADGHEVVARLVAEATSWLRPGGTLVIEIDERRGDDAAAAARQAGLVDVRVEPDLTGAARALVARRDEEADR